MWSGNGRSRLVGGSNSQPKPSPGWGTGTQHKYISVEPETINLPDCVEYHKDFLHNHKELYDKFKEEFNFEKRDVLNSDGTSYKLNRATCIFGDSDIPSVPKIWGTDNPVNHWTPELLEIKQQIEKLTCKKYNVCLCNFYESGTNTIGWHADNEERGSISSIASISLGAERIFELKENATDTIIEKKLESGSLFLMKDGCQENYVHRIPRDLKCKTGRINLTFRLFDSARYAKR